MQEGSACLVDVPETGYGSLTHEHGLRLVALFDQQFQLEKKKMFKIIYSDPAKNA